MVARDIWIRTDSSGSHPGITQHAVSVWWDSCRELCIHSNGYSDLFRQGPGDILMIYFNCTTYLAQTPPPVHNHCYPVPILGPLYLSGWGMRMGVAYFSCCKPSIPSNLLLLELHTITKGSLPLNNQSTLFSPVSCYFHHLCSHVDALFMSCAFLSCWLRRKKQHFCGV